MWENKMHEDTQAAKPPSAMAAQIKTALTPPELPQHTQTVNYLLIVQLVLCGAVLLVAVSARYLKLPFFDGLRSGYRSALEQGVNFSGQEELVKFADATVQQLQIQAQQALAAAQAQLGAQTASQPGGAGGQLAAKWPLVPAGNLLKSYQPSFALAQPVSGYTITSNYGWRKHPLTKKSDFHTGIDLAVDEGTPIVPASEGIVLKNEYNPSYGNYLLILHSDGVSTRYCHMQYVFVRQGEPVNEATVLGTVGQTGVATGPHLHFELLYNSVRYNPDAALGVA